MTQREADRWAKSFAAGLLESFVDCDTVLLCDETNGDRCEEDIGRLQTAIDRLAKRLGAGGDRPRLRL